MGGSPKASKPRKPVYWEWEPLSLRAMSPRSCRGLTVCHLLFNYYYVTCYLIIIFKPFPFGKEEPAFWLSKFWRTHTHTDRQNTALYI